MDNVRRPGRLAAFTLIEVLVVIGVIGVLMALLLPALERVRHQGYVAKCAANLHTIGQALALYANENHGSYPRTRFVVGAPLTAGTNAASGDTFGPSGPVANDTSAGVFLLLRVQKIATAVFICPYN